MKDLPIKYRPTLLKEVYGQEPVKDVLSTYFADENLPHALLFTGPSGVGKTTFAKVIANEYFGLPDQYLIEIDAATFSKAEDMRKLLAPLGFKDVNGFEKILVIDECHSLSNTAWQVLLKTLEEPPAHVYFILCTTEERKVPKTIKTRCTPFQLKEVSISDLIDLLVFVDEEEDFNLGSESIAAIAREAAGSPRSAIVYLSMCKGCEDKNDVYRTLENSEQGLINAIDLCRLIIKPNKLVMSEQSDRGAYFKAVTLAGKLEITNFEGVRIQVVNYVSKALVSECSKKGNNAEWFIHILEAFKESYVSSDKIAPLLLSLSYIYL